MYSFMSYFKIFLQKVIKNLINCVDANSIDIDSIRSSGGHCFNKHILFLSKLIHPPINHKTGSHLVDDFIILMTGRFSVVLV